MGDPIINAQVDDINTTLGNIKVDLAALRPSIRAIKDAIAETYLTDTIENVPIASFNDGADEIPVRELEVAIEPIQSGTGDPSPTNIRPISGHTEVNVVRTGVNVWDEEWLAGTYATTTGNYNDDGTARICSKNKIPCKPNTTYYMKGNCNFRFYDANENFIGTLGTTQNNTFTTPDNCYFINIVTATGYGRTYLGDISINYPSTDHDYHAYAGQTYPISLGQTVYGGTLNVTTGVLTVTQFLKTFDGTEDWRAMSTVQNGFYLSLTQSNWGYDAILSHSFVATSNQYVFTRRATTGANAIGSDPTGSFGLYGNVQYVNKSEIYIKDASKADLTAFTNYLGQHPLQVVCTLATPTTVQLTAAEVETLFGQNNIWSSSGNIIKLVYRVDYAHWLAEHTSA